MDTFELDSDAFYICTEVSPRNFVVQKAIQIDKSQIERMVGKLDNKTAVERPTSADTSSGTSTAHSPGMSPSTSASGVIAKPPPLPYWFNRECKSTLMMIGPQPQGPVPIPSSSSHQPNQFIPPLLGPPPLSRNEIKQQLKIQLEYYFSRENLITDRYLKCQMDSEQYVPITVIAGFRKIISLSTDIDLITEALKESTNVELDETEEKVRAVSKRTAITIREFPEQYKEEVEKLLADGPPYVELKYVSNDSWYVRYENELDTQVAYVSVQHRKNEVTQRPVCVRIKTGGPPSVAPTEVRSGENGRVATLSNGETGTIQLRELGQSLADFGFVPVATYRPGESNLSHFEYITPTFRFSGNSVAYQQPPPPPPATHQQYYYSSSASTTPRNFDEMSTASSNSTRTTTSNYARSGSRNDGNGNQYNESRSFSNSSNSNEWRSRVGSGGADRRFQSNGQQNYAESHGSRQQNGRGAWRGGQRNGVSQQPRYNHQNGSNNFRNENGHSQSWRYSDNNTRYSHHRHAPPVSSSSSSSASSKYFSPEAICTPTNSGPSTPPPVQQQPNYSVPTPTDLPAPPVWPAPSFDRRRKSSEASSITITTNTTTNTLTPSTPVTPPTQPTFVETNDVKQEPKEMKKQNGHAQTRSKPEPKSNHVVEQTQSPPAHTSPSVITSFAFEETAFPCLPQKVEPEKKPQKPTFR